MTRLSVASTLLLAAAASQLGATDCGQITRDPGFDLWCGDSLCAWKVERGAISRVPTWNEGDPGVSLDGGDVAIEQLTPVTSHDGGCIEFDLLADVEPTAQVYFNVDIDGNGTLEQMEQLPTTNWKPLTYLIAIDKPYSGIRFELAKRGTGRAVLAQISAKIADPASCAGLGALDPGAQPDGEPCGSAADCASGRCAQVPSSSPFLVSAATACEGCDPTSCTGGQICGAGAPVSPVRALAAECVAPASAPLGALCLTAAECASGVCSQGYCSTCDAAHACANGETCGQAWTPGDGWFTTAPTECAPGLGHRTSGQACLTDLDCASTHCLGAAAQQCADGRPCATNADCPFGIGSAGPLQNGTCATVGVQGGTCQ